MVCCKTETCKSFCKTELLLLMKAKYIAMKLILVWFLYAIFKVITDIKKKVSNSLHHVWFSYWVPVFSNNVFGVLGLLIISTSWCNTIGI